MKFKKFLIEKTSEDLRGTLLDFFRKNPYPSDSSFHAFCKSKKFDTSTMESIVYELLCDYMQVGRHNDVPDEKFDPEELQMGIKIEYEHINPDGACGRSFATQIATSIAKDHLSELRFILY